MKQWKEFETCEARGVSMSAWPLKIFHIKVREVLQTGGRPARKADKLTAVSRSSRENVGASTSHNPMGVHGLLQGYFINSYERWLNSDNHKNFKFYNEDIDVV
jgi:hypothetical protein